MILLHFKVLPGQIVQVRQAVGTDRSMYNLDQMPGRGAECSQSCQATSPSELNLVC